jgi:hypothetical protein
MKQASRVTCIAVVSLCVFGAAAEKLPDNATLPDAPVPVQETSPNPHTPASAPSIVSSAPAAPVGQLGVRGKFSYYVKSEFAPLNFVIPAAGALYQMANPPDQYPHEWKDGGGAFGRNYGDIVARGVSTKTAIFATGVMLREDPRYFPSTDRRYAARAFHAAWFTLIDKGDSGHNRVAVSNFVGAAAGGFVGNAYLPPGYRDATHAEQRSLDVFAGIGIANELSEFRPEIRLALKKAHVPFVK